MKKGVSKYPELAGLHGQDYIRAWDQRFCRVMQAQNLTERGTPRQRRIPNRHPDLVGLPKKEYNRIRAQRWRASRRNEPSALESVWRLERSKMGNIEVQSLTSSGRYE